MQKDERDERPEPPELNPEEVLSAEGHNSMKFVEISIKDIEQNENSRVIYKAIDLAELMASMKREGLLQPVGVRKLKSGKYDAVFGNRRIMAAQKLGWKACREAAAAKAFDKVRCDDRTDRWQVANEVAAHIRAIGDEPCDSTTKGEENGT